jgi:hypothetical protein
MCLLANENFPLGAIVALRVQGLEVAWVRSDAPGSSDGQMAVAALSQRDDWAGHFAVIENQRIREVR